MAFIIRGKEVAAAVLADVAARAEAMRAKGVEPCLSVILVGDDLASHAYVAQKRKAAEKVAIRSEVLQLPETASEAAILELVRTLNADPKVHGVLCQLPLPNGMNDQRVIRSVAPEKDVDGFLAPLCADESDFLPCTPSGVMEMLRYCNIEVEGKRCVVVGRSNIVGKPMAILLLRANGTVTICHSRTPDLAAITSQADILISAAGSPGLIRGDMVKEGAAVIDVGTRRGGDGKLRGDVAFDEVVDKVAYISPVPGGVGPMTIAMLMRNTILACERQQT